MQAHTSRVHQTNMDPQQLFQQARQLHESGDLQQAETLYRQILQHYPQHANTLYLLGTLAYQQGQHDKARQYYLRTVEIRADYAEAWNGLGHLMQLQGKPDAAIQYFHKALDYKNNYFDALYNLAVAQHERQDLEAACKNYQRALKIRPDFAAAWNNLGNILRSQGDTERAIQYYQQALTYQNNFVEAYYNLGIAMQDKGQLEKAMQCYRQALEINPDIAEIHHSLGDVLSMQGKLEAAKKCYQYALRINSDLAGPHYRIANILNMNGQDQAAIEHYQKALKLDRYYGAAAYELSLLIRHRDCHIDIRAIEALLKRNDLPPKQQIFFNFSLGNIYESKRDYDRAFKYFEAGNRAKRATYQYDIALDKALFKNIMTVFNKNFFNTHRHHGNPDYIPIFILGMPRSGTTLIEQILASHPKVAGSGENNELSLIIGGANQELIKSNFPFQAHSLNSEDINAFTTEYQQRISSSYPESQFITDKSLINYKFIGMIRLMFPHARLIHCWRDPLDTCLSCYKHYFSGIVNYAYDLTELGRFYLIYQELMNHWHQVLPGFIYDIHYEDLIANQEEETRKLLDYCDLPWHDDCLAFHKTARTVKTASLNQVRRPLYNKAVQHWEHYRNHLSPLLEALGQQ